MWELLGDDLAAERDALVAYRDLWCLAADERAHFVTAFVTERATQGVGGIGRWRFAHVVTVTRLACQMEGDQSVWVGCAGRASSSLPRSR